jgi:4-amino-4-deoxy-L-arabinose transferase-like glycosyltransferase
MIAAGVIAVALILPFVFWGNPYPRGLLAYWLFGTLAVVAVGTALFLWYDDVVTRVSARIAAVPSPVFMIAAGLVTALLSAAFAIYSFHRFASTSDEIAQLWHARILLTGRWSLPADPNPEFFSLDTVVDSGRWYSQFPIGGPLVLAVGALIGAPWLVNPLLAGASTIFVYRFARRAYGEPAARWATALFAAAPMVLMMAGTWMNHVPVLFFATVALAALAAWDQAATPRTAFGAAALIGFAVGMIATIRPLDAVVAAAIIGAFQLWRLRDAPRRFRELIAEIAIGTCCIGFLLYVNSQTTGRALRFGYEVAWGPAHRVGFHVDPYGNPHTLFRGLDYALSYFSELNIDLMLWPVPVLLVLLAGLWATRRPSRWDVLLLALLGAQTVAYGAYWYRGELLGPRFLYTVLPAVIILISRAPAMLEDRVGARACRAVTAGMVACMLVAWAAPTSTVGVLGMASHTRAQRRALKVDMAGAVRDAGLHHAVVFLREPFSQRLIRRLWALGVARGAAPGLVQTHDACVLLTAIEAAERDTVDSRAAKVAALAGIPPVVNPEGSVATDPSIHVASRASLTPACEAEINGDNGQSPVPFGAALVLEPIDARGRIDGDVVYAADLGAHNEVLRGRFGDRAWYRLRLANGPQGPKAVLVPY